MALTLKQKEIINRQIGILEGITWAACLDDKMRPIAEAIDVVCNSLEGLLESDGGANDGKRPDKG